MLFILFKFNYISASNNSVFSIDTYCPCLDSLSCSDVDDLLVACELCIFVHFTDGVCFKHLFLESTDAENIGCTPFALYLFYNFVVGFLENNFCFYWIIFVRSPAIPAQLASKVDTKQMIKILTSFIRLKYLLLINFVAKVQKIFDIRKLFITFCKMLVNSRYTNSNDVFFYSCSVISSLVAPSGRP